MSLSIKLFLLLSLSASLPFQGFAQQSDSKILTDLREGLQVAFHEKSTCLDLLDKYGTTKSTDPVTQGYIGALHIAHSRHAPLTDKIKHFKTGRVQLENSIARKPDNLELIFLRLTIQSNLPGILGYSGNLVEDKQFVQNHYREGPPVLKKRIVTFVHKSDAFTPEEKAKFTPQ